MAILQRFFLKKKKPSFSLTLLQRHWSAWIREFFYSVLTSSLILVLNAQGKGLTEIFLGNKWLYSCLLCCMTRILGVASFANYWKGFISQLSFKKKLILKKSICTYIHYIFFYIKYTIVWSCAFFNNPCFKT